VAEDREFALLGEAKSKWTEVKRGVLQGSILRPLLFILYVNDLPQIVQNSSVKQCAVDTTMTLVAKDVAALEKGLERDLEGVLRWANGNGLKLNTAWEDKTIASWQKEEACRRNWCKKKWRWVMRRL